MVKNNSFSVYTTFDMAEQKIAPPPPLGEPYITAVNSHLLGR